MVHLVLCVPWDKKVREGGLVCMSCDVEPANQKYVSRPGTGYVE